VHIFALNEAHAANWRRPPTTKHTHTLTHRYYNISP